MSANVYFTELLSYLVFFPAALLCYLPMKNQLCYGAGRTAVRTIGVLGLLTPLLALVDAAFSLGYNTLMVPAIVLLLAAFSLTVKVPFCQSFAVFVLICAFFGFLSNFANAFDASRNPQGNINDFSLTAAWFQLGLCLAFTALAAYPLLEFGSWLIDNFHLQKVWYTTSLVSGIFLTLNLLMYPRKYETLHTNNVALFVYTALPLMMLLLVFLCAVFYFLVKEILEMSQTRERNRLLEMEEGQYRRTMHYLEESARVRHDFRHAIGILEELLSSGDLPAAREYLLSYRLTLPRKEVVLYCGNAALNALLNYYAESAAQHSIRLRMVLDLPDSLPLSDVDLCNIVGNLLDNAITACRDLPEPGRWIDLTISCPNEVRFGIVASNSFSGKVRMSEGRYVSSHPGGNGIGLSSVSSIAERCGGTASFRHDGQEFVSGVVIPMKRN